MTRLIIANPEATAKATVTPVDIVLMSLDTRIESAQEDFLFHARWAARDLERVIRDAEAGTPSGSPDRAAAGRGPAVSPVEC